MHNGPREPIAIIGIGCRFPGSNNPQEFWRLLQDGKTALQEVPRERWDIERFYDPDPEQPGKMITRWAGFIDQVDQFDWRTFRIPPREAKYMDPQHRLLLEVAWESLEDAGLPFEQVAGSSTGVFIGISSQDYLHLQLRDLSQLDGYTLTGNRHGVAANRISYTFDFKGPSISVDTDCSSALVAIQLACQSLWSGETQLALAGAANLLLSPEEMIVISKAGLLSPGGSCKTLDAHADGFVLGEGTGVVVLKPLSQVQHSDRVYALIQGITLNHNGHNEWIIASSQAAQEALLQKTYQQAGISPAAVDYVELHGTGFLRGDPIEAKALGAVLGVHQKRNHPCLIGSVKTNIGHLEAASGIASIIKVALALHHRQIPPTLNLQIINPDIPLQDLHLAAQQTLCPWPQTQETPLAGVTTLSFTGANAHAVLSAHLAPISNSDPTKDADQFLLLPLSARSKEALFAQAITFKDFLNGEGMHTYAWRDICYTASTRRTHHPYRTFIFARTTQEASRALEALIQTGNPHSFLPTTLQLKKAHTSVFLFANKISQDLATLIEDTFLSREVAFQTTVDQCKLLFDQYSGRLQWETTQAQIGKYASPEVCFTLQLALARLWNAWGIIPDAVLGEGLGEIIAACLAESLTLEIAIRFIAQNGKTIQEELPLQPAIMPIYSAARGILCQRQDVPKINWLELGNEQTVSVTSINQLFADKYDVFVEMGSPSILSGAILACLQDQDQHGVVLPSLYQDKEAATGLLETLGTLYTLSYDVKWSAFYKDQGHNVSLPTYSWQRERVWLDQVDTAYYLNQPNKANGQTANSVHSEHAPAQNISVEEMLMQIWGQVLGLEDVKPQDSFFELGGHSLLAGQLITRIQTELQIDISLSDILQAPTPVECSALITTRRTTSEQALVAWPIVAAYPEQRYLPFPTTDIQQAYWIGRNSAFEGGNVGNHAYIEVEADTLDLRRLITSMRMLIERHEMLRAILLPDGQQKILEHVPSFQIPIVDLRGHDPQAVATQLEHIRHHLDHQIIPLEQWPAFHIFIAYFDNRHARLYLSVESLFVDAWSLNLLIQEFLHFYYAPEVPLPHLELSFRDYILAETTLHTTELYQRSQEYWVKRLPTLPPTPELPLASSSNSILQPRFVHRMSRLDAEKWQHLKARAAQAGLTPSGVLLAAFAEVLATWSKSPRFSINLSIFNRLPLHPQVNDIVGDFTSLIVLAVDHTDLSTFESRARHLQAQLWSDLDHSYYSGIRVLRELVRTQGGILKAVMPIVFTSFLIKDTASPYPSPWQETVYCVTQTPQVWLDHQVLEERGTLVFHWESIDANFPDGLMETLFATYCQIIQRLATEETSWQEVLWQIPAEQLTARIQRNATRAPVSSRLLHTLFIEQALLHAQQLAVIAPQRTLTYQDVYTGSLTIGQQLRQLGAKPNQLVAVLMEKGWEQVVGVMGVLQSGAAYLPIDPHLPHERQMYLLEHGEVHIVLTQSWVHEQQEWPEHLHCICVDQVDLQCSDVQTLEPLQNPEDLAYVIYTSGSTGLPKGVMIDHRGAVNTILDINQRFGINSTDRILALSALNFDLSVYDIFGLLAAGGTIVMPEEGSMRKPDTWLHLLQQAQVTIWNSVPALLQILVDYAEVHYTSLDNAFLRLVLLSGDWIPLTLPGHIKTLIPAIEVISLGGATEASIWSILYPITSIDPTWKSIPYGHPMLNQHFSVLNEHLEPCPVWVPGQLYISGIGLAKGYWRDEAKTLTSFFIHPRTGERLYRTGDLGRYLPDGNIEFLGREDFQVKIQGHRIELGEIEETLLQHPAVRSAVASAITDSQGEKRLVAYVVFENEQSDNAAGPGSTQQKLTTPDILDSKLEIAIRGLTASEENAASLQTRSEQYIDPQRFVKKFGQASIRKDITGTIFELSPGASDGHTLQKYQQRLSYRQFLPDPVPFEQFSAFLDALHPLNLDGLPKYLYPSAGSIYPVQVYIAIKEGGVENLSEGMYYYNAQSHHLVLLSDTVHLQRNMHGAVNQPIFDESAFSLFLIGDLNAISSEYKNMARDFCFLEAGYMSQLLMMEAPQQQIGVCPIGEIDAAHIRDACLLKDQHILLHTLLCGSVNPIRATGWSFIAERREDSSLQSAKFSPPNTTELVTALHSFLKEKLPEYMLPAAIMPIDALPLTTNGKVERKNLPLPEITPRKTLGAYVAPASEMEHTIAAIWQEMLPAAKVSVQDNFFDLGGTSLLMVRAYSKLHMVIGRNMSIVEMFFQYPTIRALANFLTQGQVGPTLEESRDQQQNRIEGRRETVQQQRQARLKHRTIEKSEDHAESKHI